VQVEPQMVSSNYVSKIRSTLKQFVREWSKEGQKERDCAFIPLKTEVLKYFPNPIKENGNPIKILFPGSYNKILGCGLGRILVEFASSGFEVQGNEFSYFMLIPAMFILNNVEEGQQFALQPYIHTFTNNINFNGIYYSELI
jgi:carnosine N-methyltransferase